VLPFVAGFAAYFSYLLFLLAVLLKEGAAGVERVAKVVPVPKWWIEPAAKAIAAWRSGQDEDRPDDRDGELPPPGLPKSS